MGIPKESADLVEKRADELKRIIPEAFSEGNLDFNKLKEALGDLVEAGGERYSFNWAGRIQSLRTRDRRSKGTLIPSKKESITFDETNNIFIEGENLEVLKILQKSYEGKIKMIYIDPPYNTGNDFVYKDDFSDNLKKYLKDTGQINGNGEKTTTDTETSGRYHSNWLSMMYPRLFLARNLLSEEGVIFVSIDDNEVHNLRLIMNEIFGEENFIGQITREAIKGGSQSKFIRNTHDYILIFAKDINSTEFSGYGQEGVVLNLKDEKGPYAKGRELNKWGAASRREDAQGMWYPIPGPNKEEVYPIRNDGSEGRWRLGTKKMLKLVDDNDAIFEKRKDGTYIVYQKIRDSSSRIKQFTSIFKDKYINAKGTESIKKLFGTERAYFDYSKPVELVYDLLVLADVNDDDIVVDFFAGSGVTAQAVLERNVEDGGDRKFILVQLPEHTPQDSEARKAGYKTIADICKERIRLVISRIKEEQKKKGLENKQKLDLGFKVFKLSKSNCFVWDSEDVKEPNTLAKHIEESAKGAKNADRDALIYELMLREGFSLDSKVETEKHGKNILYKISDSKSSVWMCFDDHLDEDAVRKLALTKDDKLVVLDSSLTDTQKVNLARSFRVETI